MRKRNLRLRQLLPVIILLLAIEIYALEVIDPIPTNSSAGNPINTQVTFKIISNIDTAGVDISTVEINIDGTIYEENSAGVQWTLLGQYAGLSYRFIIQPTSNFAYGDSVNVSVTASDLSGAAMDEVSWYFWVIDDNVSPLVWNQDPAPGETEVALDEDIRFDVTDGLSGIAPENVSVDILTTVSGIDESYSIGTNLTYSAINYGYRFELDLDDEYAISDTVSVTVHAIDNAGNTTIEEYYFYVITSLNYTYTGNYNPQWGAQNVPVDTAVSFNIYNMVEDVFVDTASIVVRIQGQQYSYASAGNFELEPIDSPQGVNLGYQVTVLPYNNFNYNQLVMVQIDADDTEGEHMETVNYSFRTINDTAAPTTSSWAPYPNQEEVPVDTSIYFKIKDLLSGVDINSVTVWLDSLEFNNLDDNFAYSEIVNGYEVTITPEQPYNSEQEVDVLITGADNLGNAMNFSYSFTTEVVSEDTQPPFLLDVYPEDGAQNLPLDTEISFRVYDADPGIDVSSIRLRVNNVQVTADVEPDSAFGITEQGYFVAYRVRYQLDESTAGTIGWQVQAEDMADNIYNADWDEPFSFSITASMPPYINLPAEFIFLEDSSLELDFRDYAGDPDGGFPNLTVSGDNNVNVGIDDYMVELSAGTNWNGSETIIFSVDDGIGNPVSDQVLVRVIAVNDPPTINLPSAGWILEEDASQTVDFAQYVDDIDGDDLILQASGQVNVIITINGLNVTISAEEDWFGIENVTFTVYDNAGRLSASQEVPIEFTSVDEPPQWVNLPGTFIMSEDGTEVIDFEQYIYEPEGQPVELAVSGDNQVDVDIDGTIVTFTVEPNWFGADEMVFLVRDSSLVWVEASTTVRVLGVNDAPSMNLPASVTVDEDGMLEIDFSQYVSDVDGDPVYLSSYGNQYIDVTIDTLIVRLTPQADWNGSETIAFIAQDAAGASVLDELMIIVNPLNDLPEIDFPPYIEFAEDTVGEFDLSQYITDIDGDDLTINIAGNDSISYELEGMNLSLSAPPDWSGIEILSFNVNDGMGGSVNADLEVRVTDTNDAPVLNLPATINFDEDGSLEISFTDSLWVTDADNDDITILPSGNNKILTQVVGGDIVIFSAEQDWNGSENITFLAIDGHGGVASGVIQVIVNPVNDAPLINLPGSFTFAEGTSLNINMMQFLDDVDLYDTNSDEALSLSCSGNQNVTVAINGLEVDFGSVPEWNGSEVLTFTVSDFEGLTDEDNVTVQVSIWQNNHAPELNLPLPTLSFAEDGELVVDFMADSLVIDIDGDELLISVLNNDHIIAAEDGAVVTFTADENWNGTETIGFFADDQNGGFVQGELSFVVTPVQDELIFDLPNNFHFEEGSYRIEDLNDYIIDVDEDELSLEYSGNENIIIDEVGPLTVNMHVTGSWTGFEVVTFTIDDGFMAVADSVNIIVTEGTWNHAPQFVDLPSSFSFEEDSSFSFDFTDYIYDQDEEDEFILTVSGVNSHIHYNINGLELSLWADENWHGDDNVLFTVYDTQPSGGRASATANIDIIITPVNDAPYIDLPDYFTFEEGNSLQVDFSAYIGDVDGTTPQLTGNDEENVLIGIVGSVVTFSAEEDWFGSDTLSFMVSDGVLSAIDSLEIIVTEGSWNNPPVISEDFPDSVGYNEDTQYVLDFGPFVTDEDGDDWIVTFAYNQYIGATVNNNVVTFRSNLNWHGMRTLNFTIHELRSRVQVPGEIDVTVYPVNDAPQISLPSQFVLEENEQLIEPFADYLYDVDGDVMTLSVTGNDTIDVEIIAGNVVRFTPQLNWHGSETMTFTVYDDSLSASDVVNVTVEQGDFNHPPEMNLPEEIVLDEDTTLEVDFSPYISDEDGDELVLTAEYNENILVIVDELEVTFVPSLNWHGSIDIDFTVYDTYGGSRFAISDELTVTVISVNDEPELDLPDNFSFEENGSLQVNFALYSYDADGDYLTITWTGNENINIIRDGYLITFSCSGGWSGSEFINFYATDGPGATATDSVEVIVNAGNINHPPELDLPETFLMEEDVIAEFDFAPYMSDVDDDELIITAGYNPVIAVDITGSMVTLIPAENYFGSQTLTFTVYDSQGSRASASDDVVVEVAAVNDIPTITLPDRFTFSNAEPSLINFAPFIDDPDGEVLTITFSGNDEISVNIAYPQVIFSASVEFSGSENITFTVTDGSGESASDEVIVQAISGSTNTPPEINLPDEFIFDEDTEFEVDFLAAGYIFDIDDDDMTLLVYGQNHVIVEIVGTLVTISAETDWNGEEELTFYVFDDMGRETASDEADVIVDPVNDAPVISLPLDGFRFTEGEELEDIQFGAYITDPDANEVLSLSVSESENIIVNISHPGNNIILVDFSAPVGFTGSETLTFTVTDSEDETGSNDVSVTVEPGDWNHPPEFNENMPSSITINEDSLYTGDFSAFIDDEDGDDIVLSVTNTANLDILIDGLEVTIIPDLNWFGNTSINFTAYDTTPRAAVSTTVEFIVLPVNDPPVILLPDEWQFEENSYLQINFGNYINDVEGDELEISWNGNEEIIVEPAIGYNIRFSETGFIGSETISFSVNDGSASATDSVLVTVYPGQWNHPPYFINLPDNFELDEDTTLEIDFGQYITDEDEDDLLFITADYNPVLQVIVAEDTLVTLIPALNYHGTTTLTLNLIDNVLSRAITSTDINVVVNPVNDAPTINLPTELSMTQEETLGQNFIYFVDDVDGDDLTLTHGGSEHLEIQIANYYVTFILDDEDWFGNEIVTFTVWDDSLSASDDITIRVYQGSINEPPEIDLPAFFTFAEDSLLTVDFMAEGYISDEENDELFITVSGNRYVNVEIEGYEITFTAEENWNGSEEIVFYVFDDISGRSTASDEVDINVTPVNDAPQIILPPRFTISEDDLPAFINLTNYVSDIDSEYLELIVSGEENLILSVIESSFLVSVNALGTWIGEEVINFTVSDGSLEGSDTAIIEIIPGEDNHPPTIELPADLLLLEDDPATFNFSSYIDDIDNDDLVITVGNYSNLTIDIDQYNVTISPAINWNGSRVVEFTVYDTQGRASASDQVTIIVEPVNDPPSINLPAAGLSFEENSLFEENFSQYVSDVDGDLLSLSWDPTEILLISNQGLLVYISAPESWFGEEMVSFHVYDGTTSASDSVLVTVEQGDFNHDPVMTLPESWTMAEDTEMQIDFSAYIEDSDDDELVLYYVHNQYIQIIIEETVVTFIPAANYFGSQTLEFRLVDVIGERAMVSDTAVLQVTAVNDPPVMILPDEFGFLQSAHLYKNFNRYIDDIDSEELVLECLDNDNISVNIEELIVEFYLAPDNDDWYGTETITFQVVDDSMAIATDIVEVTVFQGNVNNPPSIALPATFNFEEDETLSLDFEGLGYVSDPDGDALSLTVSDNENVTVDIFGTYVTLGALANWNGNEELTFWVIDEEGQAESDQVWIQVAAVNDPPVIDLPYQLNFEEGTTGTLVLNDYFHDIDSNTFTVEYSGTDHVSVEIEEIGVTNITYRAEFTAEEDWTGSDTLSFVITDNLGASGSDDIIITVTPGAWNHEPTIELPEGISFDEDEAFTFDLTQYIDDVDGDYLLVYPQESTHISISIDPDTLVTLTPAENWFGTETIGFTIHDSDSGTRLSAFDQMEVTVESVNDLPVFNLPEIFEFEENASLQLNFANFVYDVETAFLDISYSGNDTLQVQLQGYTMLLSAPQNWTGQEMLTFTATDDSLASVSDSCLVRVNLGTYNHSPEINLPSEGFTLAEDTQLEIDFSPYIIDPDGDALVIDAIQDAFINVSIVGNLVTFIPDADYNGSRNLSFTVIDNIGRLQATDDVMVTVTPVNDPPSLNLPPELSLSINSPRSINFSSFITDIDQGDTHTLTHSGNELIQIEIEGLWVNMVSNWVGSEWINFTIEDSYGASFTDSLQIFVYAEQANNDPAIILPDQFIFDEDTSLEIDFNLYINDIDGDDLSLLVTGNSMIEVDITPNEIVTFSAAANWHGTEELTFIVTDSYSFSTDEIEITVLPVNDPPTLNLPNGFTFAENTTLDIPFYLYMDDIDGDPLNISFSGNSNVDVEVIASTVRLSCSGWYGQETITFTVDDGYDEEASDDVLITITEGVENHAPELEMPASFTTEEDQVLVIDMTPFIFDLDGDPMIINVNGEQHTNVSIYGYDVYINPESNWHGTETLTFIVYDNVRRASDAASSNIIVTPVNDEPVIDLPYSGFSFDENSNLLMNFSQYLQDVDGDQLSLECEGNTNITVQINSLSVNLSAVQYWNGTEVLTFTVNDGNGGSCSDQVPVTVNYINNPPYVAQPIQNFSMNEDTSYTSIDLNQVFDDHDLEYGDNLTYTWYGDIHLQVAMENGQITITPETNWFGNETLTFRATDSEGLFIEDNVNVLVNSVNDLPVVVVDESITAQADASGFASVWLDANGSWDVDGTIVNVLWSWDGGSVQGMVVQQSFAPGYYEIAVQATDNQGGVGEAVTYLSVAEYDNQIPVALDDYYEVYETSELIVYANNGLLANDYDPDESPEPLTAVLVNEPADGTLVQFNDNGSFIYLADNIINHDVTFSYQAFDGQAYSLIRTVHITVNEILLDDAVITVNSVDEDSTGSVLNIPILTSDLIPEWDVRSFEFDLHFADGVLEYSGYNLEEVITDSLATIQITQNRGSLHCEYSSSEVITGEGSLINLNFNFFLGHSPLEVTNFYYNETSISEMQPGAVNNHYPQLVQAIIIDTLSEDFDEFTQDLDQHFSDVDGDDLYYSVDYEDDEIIAEIAGNLLVLNSVPDWFGTTEITITATDNYTLTQPEVYTFYPEIQPVNDPPAIQFPEFFSFPEDSSLVVNMTDYVNDPDFDELQLDWSGNENISISDNNLQLTFTAEQDWYGSEMITFEIDDQVTGRLVATDSVEVIVTPVNDIPVLLLPISFSFDEDESYSVDFMAQGYVYDLEGDEIILSAADNENIIIDIDGTEVTFSAPLHWNGNEDITFFAHDDQDTTSVNASTQIIIHPVNDPPELHFPPEGFHFDENTTAEENTINFADSIIYDPDNEILEITVDDGEFINITIEGTFVSFEPVPNWDGSERRTFTVSDNVNRAEVSGSVRIYVYDVEPNQAPVIILPPQGITYTEDGQHVVNFADSLSECYVYDEEDDEIVLIVGGSENITANVEGLTVTFGTVPDFFGSDEVVITAFDHITRSVSEDTLLVTVSPVNDPPEIELPENIVLVGDTTRVINFGQYLEDIDNNINDLNLTAQGQNHVGVEIFNTVVSFTSPSDWEGEEVIYFSVIDNGAVPDQDSLVVIVEQVNINHAPQISLPANFSFDEDSELTVDFNQYISDQDNDDLFLTVSGNNNIGVQINSENTVVFSADQDWYGQETIIFTVYDSQNRAFDSEDILISVNPVNDPPRFDPVYDMIMERDQVLEIDFAVYAYDIEGDSFSLALSIGTGLAITQSNTKFTIIPQEDCPEVQNLTLTAAENTSGISSEIMFGLHVKAPAVDLKGLTNAVNNGVFTFPEGSGSHTIDLALYLETDYDLVLTSPLAGSTETDSLDISINNYSVTFTPQGSWIGTVYVPFTINYLYGRARRDFEIKVTVRAAKNGEYIEIDPHLVTWKWPTANIIVTTGEPPGNISARILNRRGVLVSEINDNPQTLGDGRFLYTWDKKDADGNPVDGGLFIYQFDINGKLYQGTIIIVR